MKNRLIKTFGLMTLLSHDLLAIPGAHGGLATGAGGDNGELCVYCHTPHGSNADYSNVPLWNKPTSSTVYTMYGATSEGVEGVTLAGTPTDKTPSDSSMACLSCHDGISAMNSVINAPGSGKQSASGIIIGNDYNEPKHMTNQGEYLAVGLNGDMTNDHPISIQYIVGRGSLKPLDSPLDAWDGAMRVSDLLRNGKVQCASCHNPHNTIPRYQRKYNANSELCFGCHDK